jgi:hypothetical protein
MTRSSALPPARGLALLTGIAGFALTGLAGAANLVRNGDFSAGMTDWVKALEFGATDPVQAGAARIYSPTPTTPFTGTVLSQGMNVPGIAGQTLSAAVDLAKTVGSAPGASLRLAVEFTRADGSRQSATLIQPNNGSYPYDRSFKAYVGGFTFPADAVKLVKVALQLVGPNSFAADNLTLTGPFSAGPVPAITAISPAAAAYSEPVTISGSAFGSTPGTLTIAGSPGGVVVDSWSDTRVVFHLLNPNHGGVVGLEAADVMANHNLAVGVTSPHYTVTLPASSVMTLAGQPVKLDALVGFHNDFTTAAGIQLTLPGAGDAAEFTPLPIRFQGGACLTFDTAGLAPGVHAFSVQSSDGTTAGNPVPLTLDVRTPSQLSFSAWDPLWWEMVPVTGTLVLDSYAAISTAFTLVDPGGADISAAAKLVWSSSNPAVVQVKQTSDEGNGPTLYAQANGTCTLTATGAGGFTAQIPVQVALASGYGIIASAGFTSAVTDNSGTGPLNRFTATTTDGASIVQIDSVGFAPVNVATGFGATGWMDFSVPQGLAPGIYEFAAENDQFVRRSALLTVANAPGKGLVSGRISRSFAFGTPTAGTLEFYDAATGALGFSRSVAAYGDYVLGHLDPGSYRLRFVPFTPAGSDELEAPWYPNAPDYGLSEPVTVTADTTTTDLNFFVFKAAVTPPSTEVEVPRILSFIRSGNSVTLTFETRQGLRYVTEFSDAMVPGSWISFDTFNGDGGSHPVTDATASGPRRFYRVVTSVP